jgi:hypothetical protein
MMHNISLSISIACAIVCSVGFGAFSVFMDIYTELEISSRRGWFVVLNDFRLNFYLFFFMLYFLM